MHATSRGDMPEFEPKRGRPSREQAAAISRSIMDAAADVFLAQGFDGATMEAIAAQAQVPKSTLYKRFANKTVLLRAVLNARVAAWSTIAAGRNWMLTDRLEQRLSFYAAAILTWSTSPEVRAFSRLAASAWNQPSEIPERLDAIGYTEMLTLIERDIAEFGSRDGITASHPRRVAEALMALLFGWVETRGTSASQSEATDFAETAVSLLLHGRSAW